MTISFLTFLLSCCRYAFLITYKTPPMYYPPRQPPRLLLYFFNELRRLLSKSRRFIKKIKPWGLKKKYNRRQQDLPRCYSSTTQRFNYLWFTRFWIDTLNVKVFWLWFACMRAHTNP
uniref:Secreted protein n=1 Tax=Juglanconis juglandina TaxID=1940567 RepID=A0A291LIY9_9PEZI|nr:hypothetical protein [Juglanconis juglandina]